jgi:hypothetical protein
VSYPGTTEDNEHRAKAVECESDTVLLLQIAATGGKKSVTGNQRAKYIFLVK